MMRENLSAMERRQQYLKRAQALESERSSWISHWKDLSEYLSPRTSRWLLHDRNKGGKRNDSIINSTPLRASGVLAAGMMTSITSPARKWFTLTIPGASRGEEVKGTQRQDLREVKAWLALVERELYEILAGSNIYSALSAVYLDLGTYALSSVYIEEDERDVVRAYLFPLGSYCLSNSARLSVDTVYRKFAMTTGQLVEKFGRERVSDDVRDAYDRRQLDAWHSVLHIIEPNPAANLGKLDAPSKPYRSVWLELAGGEPGREFLREAGYDEFPAIVPRWSLTGEDVYGSDCPGMRALGDAKALQTYEKEGAKATARGVTPPIVATTALRNQRVSLVPGDVTYGDAAGAGAARAFVPAVETNPTWVQILESKIERIERRIDGTFYADLFLSLLDSDRRQITAEEVRARQQEKMLQLGPVLERLNDELLEPLIDRVFAIALRAGRIPPPPPELEGQEIRVEYLSILSQAQKALGTAAIERVVSAAGQVAQVQAAAGERPQVLDNVDFDAVLRDLAEMIGVPPGELRSARDVEQQRAARAQAEQAAQAGQAALGAAQGARDLAAVDMGGDNALTRLLGTMGPQAAAAVGDLQ